MRFAKPNGESFDMDYMGSIHCFDNGNDLIAICDGGISFCIEDNNIITGDIGNPECWDDWRLVIDVPNPTILQKAIAACYSGMIVVDSIVEYSRL